MTTIPRCAALTTGRPRRRPAGLVAPCWVFAVRARDRRPRHVVAGRAL